MSGPERLRRDLAIWFEASAGIKYRDIAERYGISVKTVQRAIKRVEDKNSPLKPSADQLTRYRLQLDHAIEELGLVRLGAPNDRTKVAAIRRQSELMAERLQIALAIGSALGAHDDEPKPPMGMMDELFQALLSAARRDGLGSRVERWLVSTMRELAESTPAV